MRHSTERILAGRVYYNSVLPGMLLWEFIIGLVVLQYEPLLSVSLNAGWLITP